MSAVNLLAQISETYSTDYFYREQQRQVLQLGGDKRVYLYFCLPLWFYNLIILKAELILYAVEYCIACFPESCRGERTEVEYTLYPLQEIFNVLGRTVTPPSVNLEQSVPFTSSCKRNYTAVDITKIVQSWCGGCSENNGLMLMGADTSLKTFYASAQHEITGVQPTLRVTFQSAGQSDLLRGLPCGVRISQPLQQP